MSIEWILKVRISLGRAAQSRGESRGALDRFIHGEGFAEERRGLQGIAVVLGQRDDRVGRRRKPDPFRPPIGGVQQPHRPPGRLAPVGDLAGLIPDAHFPEAGLARRRNFPVIDDLDGLVRFDLAAVPEVALILFQQFSAARDEHLIRRLPAVPRVCVDDPAQAGLKRVHAEGV